MTYDYWITYPFTPAFEDNVNIMLDNIIAEGEGPTLYPQKTGTDRGQAANGTKSASGLQLLHYRLTQLLSDLEAIAFLHEGMSNPMPPITIEFISSVDGNITHQAIKDNFLPFMPDIVTGFEPGDGDAIKRPAEITDPFPLSHYAGAAEVIL